MAGVLALGLALGLGLGAATAGKRELDERADERASVAAERLAKVASREFIKAQRTMEAGAALWAARRAGESGKPAPGLASEMLERMPPLSWGDLAVADALGVIYAERPLLARRRGHSAAGADSFRGAVSEGKFGVSGPWRHKDGEPWAAIAALPLRGPGGRVEGALLGVVRWDAGGFQEGLSGALDPGQFAALESASGAKAWIFSPGGSEGVGERRPARWAQVEGTPWRAAVEPAASAWSAGPARAGGAVFAASLAAMLLLAWVAGGGSRGDLMAAAVSARALARGLGRTEPPLKASGQADAAIDDMEWAARAAAELRMKAARFEEAFAALSSATGHGVFFCAPSGALEFGNAKFEQLAGGATHIEQLAAPAKRAQLLDLFERASADQARMRWEGEVVGDEGGAKRIFTTLIPLVRAGRRGFVGVVNDVGEHGILEMRLAFERDKAERVMEAVSEAVLYLDGYGQVERLSAGMSELLGRAGTELKGLWVGKALLLVDRYDGTEAAMEELLTQDRIDSDRWLLVCGRDQPTPVELRWRKLREESFEGVLSLRDITARVDELDRARWEATHDSLTGLLNRRAFETAVEAMRAKMAREPFGCAILMVDLDGFKWVNDTHGHEAGDEILKSVAEAISAGTAPFDFVARLGGDEFAVLMQGPTMAEASRTAAELREAIVAIDLKTAFGRARVDASIGVSILDVGDARGERAMRDADRTMYGVKSARKAGVL